jgi:peroxiredoxin
LLSNQGKLYLNCSVALKSKVIAGEVKKSREYIKLYSIWLSKKDSINRVGKKAMDFKLLNAKKETISFQSVAKNKIAYVEKSGSWCGNSTRLTNELKPVYEKYKDKGFEIITADPESRLDRWENWLEKHEFPWTNLVELEVDVANTGISYTDILFRGYGIANYLVDANGEVVATNISTEELNEFLMETFEPLLMLAGPLLRHEVAELIVLLRQKVSDKTCCSPNSTLPGQLMYGEAISWLKLPGHCTKDLDRESS